MILAVDVGGTKFSLAVFDGEKMVRRETRSTDRQGGRDWMLGQIAGLVAARSCSTGSASRFQLTSKDGAASIYPASCIG